MKLKDYLEQNNVKPKDFAKQVKVTPEAVGMWLAGKRRPRSEDTLAKIAAATDGQVQPNDFYAAA